MTAWLTALVLGAIGAEPVIGWTPRRVVLGETASLRITVRLPGARPDTPAPRLRASEGTLRDPERTGPGQWAATLELPAGGPPLLAIVSAVRQEPDVEPAAGFAAIPLRGRASVPLETEPGARVRVRFGDEELGPFIADERGRLEVSLAVPPGVATARVRAAGPGGQTERTVELGGVAAGRVAVEAVPAGPGRLRVEMFVAGGARPGDLAVEADRSRISRVEPVAGRPERFVAWAEGPPGLVKVRAWLQGAPQARDEVAVRIPEKPLRPSGPAAHPPPAPPQQAAGAAPLEQEPPAWVPPSAAFAAGYRARAGTPGGMEVSASLAWPLAVRGRLAAGIGVLAFVHGAGPDAGVRALDTGVAPEATARLQVPGAALFAAAGPAVHLECAFDPAGGDGCAAGLALSTRAGLAWRLPAPAGAWLTAEFGLRLPLAGGGRAPRELAGGQAVLLGLALERP